MKTNLIGFQTISKVQKNLIVIYERTLSMHRLSNYKQPSSPLQISTSQHPERNMVMNEHFWNSLSGLQAPCSSNTT